MIHLQIFLAKNNNRNIVYLIGIIALQITAYFYIKPHIINSDDIAYINSALSMIEGSYKFTPSVFTQRFLVFLPVSLLYRLFGVNIYSSTVHLLMFAIFHTIIIYYLGNKIKNGMGILAALLFGLNPLTLFLTVELLPDLICSTFILVALYFLYSSEEDTKTNKKRFHGFLFSAFLFLSILAKENIMFYLPFFLFICIRSYRLNYKFWNTAFLTFAALILLLGLFYKMQTGYFFYKLSAIESEHNLSVWSYQYASGSSLLKRVIFGLYYLLLGDSSLVLLTVLIAPLLFSIRNMIKEKSLRFWIYNFLFLLVIYQYGSTSLKSYNPIPLIPRMFFCLLPPMCLLAGYSMQEIISNKRNKWIYIMLITSAVSAMVCIQVYHLSKTTLICTLVIFTTSLLAILVNNTRLKILILFFPVIFIFVYSANNLRTNTDITKETYDNYIGKLPYNSIVIMNDRSILANKYYNFNNSNQLMFIDWANIEKVSVLPSQKGKPVYLLIDYKEVQSLHVSYNEYIPKFINSRPSDWKAIKEYNLYDIVKKNNVKSLGLYKINSLEELRNNY
jgi:hypothetical protein